MAEQATIQPTRAAALRRIATTLAQTTDTGMFLDQALAELRGLLRLTFAIVAQFDRGTLSLMAATGETVAQTLMITEAPAVEAALAAGRSVLIERPGESALVAELRSLLPDSCASLLFVPLVAQGKPRGAVALGATPEEQFAPEDVALVELVAGSLTAAVYVGRLSESMRRRNEQLAMIADISATVSSSLEPHEVYRLVVEKLGQYFRVGAGSLLLKEEATDELVFTVTIENSSERLSGVRLPPGVGIAGHVARTQQIYITNDAQNDPIIYHQVSEQIGVRCENLLAVPMVVKGNTIGVIELLNKRDGAFTTDEGERLSAVANIIGVAIENARLFEFVSRRRDRLELLLNQAKQGLSEAQLVAFLTRELELEQTLLGTLFMNPYIVGGPVREPEMCFGRGRLLMDLLGVLHQNSVLLHGERRIGKTTVLRQIELLLLRAGDSQFCFKPIYIDLEGIEEQAFFHQLMESIVDSFGKPARDLRLAYKARRIAYTGREFQRDLRAVIGGLCGPQPDGRLLRLVLLLDEADVLYTYNERVLQEFRRVFMQSYAAYFGVVFAAVGIQHEWKRYESPFYNLFQEIEIPPLSRPDTELLVRTPVRGHYDYDEQAIELIYEVSGGRPMHIQHLCLEVINHMRQQERTTIGGEDIERVSALLKGQAVWNR